MTLEYILNQAGIPLLLFVVCMFYGIRLLVVQDASGIKGKNKGPLKNEKEFAKTGGKLILFFWCGNTFDGSFDFCEYLCGCGRNYNLYNDYGRAVEENE